MLLWTLECMYLFELEFSSFLDISPGVGLLDHMVTVFLFFKGTSMLFSIVIALVYNSVGRFSFLHTICSVYCLWTFWWWPFWLVWGGTSLFWLPFFQYLVIWSIFPCVCDLSVCLLWRNVSLGLFATFWLGCLFFWYWVVWAACIFGN